MKVKIPPNSYVKNVNITGKEVEVQFAKSQKIALLFICLNSHYWPYLFQVLKDCRKNFLKNHKVEYFVWTDYNEETKKAFIDSMESVVTVWHTAPAEQKEEKRQIVFNMFAGAMRSYGSIFPTEINTLMQTLSLHGFQFKQEGINFWIGNTRPITDEDVWLFINGLRNIVNLLCSELDTQLKGVTIHETGAIQWPLPTLMRYHLFLQEEKLKDYDNIYYLDADMRVVSEVGDEILGEGLTTAPHPGYALDKRFIPPYEPNPSSEAYIPRLGTLVNEGGKQRFKPFYAAGGFQGGTSKEFVKAMEVMRGKIDKDFDKNYTAIWNDESHWNKFLWDYQTQGGKITFLDPSYVYPDSLIKEYYEPIWGRSYEPKIITLTKPFSLSAEGAQELAAMMKK